MNAQRKAFTPSIALTLSLAAIAPVIGPATPLHAQAPPPGSGPVELNGFVRVIDGDTFEAYIYGRQSGIGIVGIRTPMGNTACGRQATGFLRGLIGHGPIRLEEDPVASPYDVRKRRMYRVVLPDGRSAAVGMADAGLAFPTGEGIEKSEISAAAVDASARGRGCAR